MRFDLTDMRLFLNVHEAGTITGGAAASHMTLASASERIRNMEDALGSPLLLREPRGVQPTPAGRTLLHHARLVLRQMEQLQGELGDYAGGLKGHVRLLCNTSALSEHLPQVLSSFLAEHPGISIDLQERLSEEVVDAVRRDACDAGVASDAASMDGLETFPFRADPLMLVVPRGHALSQFKKVSLGEVAHLTFVGLAESSAMQELVTRQARLLGHRLDYRIRLHSFESVCRMVGLGTGVGVVPKAVAARCVRSTSTRMIPLTDSWADRKLVLCVKRLDALPMPAQQLVRHLVAAGQDSAPAKTTKQPKR